MPTVLRKPLGLMVLVLSLLSSCQADKLVDPDVDPNDEPGVLASGFWIPDGLADEAAVFMEPAACVLRGIRRSGVGAADGAVIIGAGSMGLVHLLVL